MDSLRSVNPENNFGFSRMAARQWRKFLFFCHDMIYGPTECSVIENRSLVDGFSEFELVN